VLENNEAFPLIQFYNEIMNLNKIKRVGHTCFLVTLIGFSANVFAADRGTLQSDASIYSSPSATSQILGRYKRGMVFPILVPERNGWFEIQFKTPFKGFNKGYVRKESVSVASSGGPPPPATQSQAAPTKRERSSTKSTSSSSRRNSLAFTGGLYMVSPQLALFAVSETATSGSHLGFAAEYGWSLSDSFVLNIGANYMTMSLPSIIANQSQSLFANGFGGHVVASYALVKSGSLRISPGIGGGVGLMSAGNVNGTPSQQITTTGIMSPLFLGRLDIDLALGESFAFRAYGGYRMFTLSAVPIFLITGAQSTVDYSLGGLFFGAGFLLYL
jgi:hypothetical protein